MDAQTRQHYLKAMGVPVWLPKADVLADDLTAEREIHPSPPPLTQTFRSANVAQEGATLQHQVAAGRPPPLVQPFSGNDALGERRGFKASEPAQQQPSTPQAEQPNAAEATINPPDCTQMDWPALRDSVTNCQLCTLYKSRTQTVFGTGDTQADWMIVGEAPGANEDRQGEPFVGRAGQLLNNMLAAVGLPRNAVYISNVLKCRPPNNRDPKPEESALCRGYLERQIALIQPKLIIVVGRIAAHNLLNVTTPLGRLRGQLHTLPGSDIPVVVTYHPAYLLRQPLEKRKAWQDLQLARQSMQKS